MKLLVFSLCATLELYAAQGLDVSIHYSESNSVIDACGLTLKVAVSLSNNPIPSVAEEIATQHGKDLFTARLHVNGSNINNDGLVAINAMLGDKKQLTSEGCKQVCGKISPQGDLVSTGPYTKVRLTPEAHIDVWPNFGCQKWQTLPDISFASAAIGGRRVIARARMPAAPQENHLARPSGQLPPILFRLNSEWYWPDSGEEYGHWHSLMVDGIMEPFIVVEVGEENVSHWPNEPIFTSKPLRLKCGACEDDISFVCRDWESYSHRFAGKAHFFGSAADFFDELWHSVVPHLLTKLPARTDVAKSFEAHQLRVGVWGYCIGGLAAWNAITLKPGLYNMAYMGSPAVDFDCGDALVMAKNVSLGDGNSEPNIYIDVGAHEGIVAIRQSRLLFHRLRDQGYHIQFSVAPFGTHQARIFLRRALPGLLALFGSDATGDFSKQVVGETYEKEQPPQSFAYKLATTAYFSGFIILSFIVGMFVQDRCAVRGKQCAQQSDRSSWLLEESNTSHASPGTIAGA